MNNLKLQNFFSIKKVTTWDLFLCFCVLSIPLIVIFGLINNLPRADGSHYVYMGANFSKYGEFYLPQFNTIYSIDSTQLESSHHFPPLFPAYLSIFYYLFGYSLIATRIAIFFLYMIQLIVIYLATYDLFKSKKKSLIVTALVGLNPYLIYYTCHLYSEVLVIIFFTLVIWAILKGIKNEKYLIIAGFFAGLGYLTKSSVGYFFLIAGICGFIWRFYYIKWQIFKSKWYIGAIGIFLFFIGVWAYRNIIIFGWPHWETSSYVSYVNEYSLNHLDLYIPMLFIKSFFLLLLLLLYGIFFIPELLISIKKWKDEENSGLLLAVFTVFFIGAIFVAAFYLIEEGPIINGENIRYILMAYVPLLWLGMKYINIDKKLSIKSIKKNKNTESILHINKNNISNLTIIILALMGFVLLFTSSYLLMRECSILLVLGIFSFLFIKKPRKMITIFLLLMLLLAVHSSSISYPEYQELTRDLKTRLRDGDSIAISTKLFSPDSINLLSLEYKIKILSFTKYNGSINTTYIIAFYNDNITNQNYSLIKSYPSEIYYLQGYFKNKIEKIILNRNSQSLGNINEINGYMLYYRLH